MSRIKEIGLPECKLLEALETKMKGTSTFDFLGELKHLHDLVRSQSDYIKVLFKEYTPHDFRKHIVNLFHIAEGDGSGSNKGLLGTEFFNKANPVELFLLAASICGHDWGMAVSDKEKDCIIQDEKPEGDIHLLPDEKKRFDSFLRERNIKNNELDENVWRDYVRETHALRSAERIRKFFKNTDGGVGEAVARICEGHGVSFETLQDEDQYPEDYSVLESTINLRALSIYLRLLDLFDLADKRTPYAVWKFVAPKNSRSRMEWEKHRALRPVTFPTYHEELKIIKVDGDTHDHEVYAALEDLRRYCEDQFERSKAILARVQKYNYHWLNIDHIEWKVQAKGFKPLSIRFEFDRSRMFEILSTEIYKGDSHVFLRELLQNSIDAIRMRQELYRLRRISTSEFGYIKVDVQHLKNGDAEVTWFDNGIGMDEYIIKNYLAVAGRSFYDSEDFRRLGIKIDPISHFGVGILSCFMMADGIEIITTRDPYLDKTKKTLRIKIPDVQKQFRIEETDAEMDKVGTTVRVFINGTKLPIDKNKKPISLEVTNYLAKTAGFVDFPIMVTEGEHNTIILHPKQDAEAARKRFYNIYRKEFDVRQLNLYYPWEDVFRHEDLASAKEFLREERVDLLRDLKMKNFDGVISFPVPKDDNIDFLCNLTRHTYIRNEDNQKGYTPVKKGVGVASTEICTSSRSRAEELVTIYRDGILLENFKTLLWPLDSVVGSIYFPFKMLINIPKSFSLQIDLARTRLLGEPSLEVTHRWEKEIFDEYQKYYLRKFWDKLFNVSLNERFLKMGLLISYYKFDFNKCSDLFPIKKWPVALLTNGSTIQFEELGQLLGKGINMFVSSRLKGEMDNVLMHNFYAEKYKGIFCKWKGERSIFSLNTSLLRSNFCSHFYNILVPYALKFIKPYYQAQYPVIQCECLIDSDSKEISTLLKGQDIVQIAEKASKDFDSLNISELKLFYWEYRLLSGICNVKEVNVNDRGYFQPFIKFLQPFENCFALGSSVFNVKHPIAKKLIELDAWLTLNVNKLHVKKVKSLIDQADWVGFEDLSRLTKSMQRFWKTAEDLGFSLADSTNMIPTICDFVPGTIRRKSKNKYLIISESNLLEEIEHAPYSKKAWGGIMKK